MTEDTPEEEVVYEFGDMSFTGPNLDIEGPSDDLPYEEHEDETSIQLLRANGIPITEEAVGEALGGQSGVLLAAAAHAAGSLGLSALVPRLRDLTRGQDDVAAVEAAYALARLGETDGAAQLRDALDRPVGPYLSPVLAAGHLAQLGDSAGLPVVREALDSDLLAVRMLGAKQMLFFGPFEGDETVDALFERALSHPDPAIQGQALAELQSLRSPGSRPLLERYLEQGDDDHLLQLAEGILASLE